MQDSIEATVVEGRAVAVRENMSVGQAMSVDEIIAQVNLIQNVMRKVMVPGEHFGKIPGCGDKMVLMQPGAQKLCMTFRLCPQYDIQEVDLPRGHKEYRIKCTLLGPNGNFVGQGVGACSSMESKYRYRQGQRKCPACGKEGTIIKGKAEFGGGWLCWEKKQGCGTKWPDATPEIENQQVDKIENPDPADAFNTVLKMAKKRAFVDATITATAASDIFTQDLDENNLEGGEHTPAQRSPAATSPTAKPSQSAAAPPSSQSAKPTSPIAKRTWKDALLDAARKGGEIWAWKLAVDDGWIMPNEKLLEVHESKVPKTNADFEAWKARVAALKAQGVTQELQELFDNAYFDPDMPPGAEVPPPAEKPIEVPRDPEAAWKAVAIPAWSKHVKEEGFKTFGDLPKEKLWWWCTSWKPVGYNGSQPKPADLALRDMLDHVKELYDFKDSQAD